MIHLTCLQEQLGYRFNNTSLLLQALTHRSFGHEFFKEKPEELRHNERLEFLGDSILNWVISDLLLNHFPKANEGQLSKMRASMVNEKRLTKIAQDVQLPQSLRLGKGEDLTGGRQKASILSSAFEAIIAAIYLDGGFDSVDRVVKGLFKQIFESESLIILDSDYKTKLQEKTQSLWKLTPSYHLIESLGPEDAKIFKIEVKLSEKILAHGSGVSKKQAEQDAAHLALLALENPADLLL